MRCFALILLAVFAAPAWAQTPPVPAHHPVKEMERKLQSEEQAKKELEETLKKLQADIGSSKKDLVSLAADIKKNETQMSKLEERLKTLDAEQEEIQARLGKDQNAMGDLILALQRIRRVPPEALLARPGAPLKTAQSAMLLESILPDLYDRAESLKGDLTRLAEIVEAVEKDKHDLQIQTAALQLRQDEMGHMVAQRQTEYKETQGNYQEREAEIRQISARAGNLKDLIKKLDERREERAAQAQAASAAARARPALRDIMPKAGNGQLPVSGIVRVRYGDRDDIGARSEGIRIEARNGALVVSPMGGIVRYAGDFRNYGQMLIIEHKSGYHSLVAGLARIDTVVGQSVAAGEPLGTMGQQGGKPELYYELRLDGQPINPARKIGDLG